MVSAGIGSLTESSSPAIKPWRGGPALRLPDGFACRALRERLSVHPAVGLREHAGNLQHHDFGRFLGGHPATIDFARDPERLSEQDLRPGVTGIALQFARGF